MKKNPLLATVYGVKKDKEFYKLPDGLSKATLPTEEEQNKLLLAHHNGDKDAVPELLYKLLPLIVRAATQLYNTSPDNWTGLSDLIHTFICQSFQKADAYNSVKFDPDDNRKQMSFAQFLYWGLVRFEKQRANDRRGSHYKTHNNYSRNILAKIAEEQYKDVASGGSHAVESELDGGGLEELSQFESDVLHISHSKRFHKKKIRSTNTKKAASVIASQIMLHQKLSGVNLFRNKTHCKEAIEKSLESAITKLKNYHG